VAATRVSAARLDSELRDNPYADNRYADARLVDPLLAKAFEDAVASARKQAHDEGFAQGYAEGMELAGREQSSELDYQLGLAREAEAARDDAMRRALEVLDAAATEFAARQAEALHNVEDLVLGAAFDLATTLLGRELEIADAPVRDAVRRALTVLPADVPLTLVVHPLDVAALGDLDALSNGRSVRIVADADIEPGSCVADGGATHVDASLAAAIDRVRQVLSP